METTLEQWAAHFQSVTGCSHNEAVRQALVTAAIFAALVGHKEAEAHFTKRATEVPA